MLSCGADRRAQGVRINAGDNTPGERTNKYRTQATQLAMCGQRLVRLKIDLMWIFLRKSAIPDSACESDWGRVL